MQTIKITVTNHPSENVIEYTIDGKTIAEICPDGNNPGKYVYNVKMISGNYNVSLAAAKKAVRSKISGHFAAWGLNVEFTNN